MRKEKRNAFLICLIFFLFTSTAWTQSDNLAEIEKAAAGLTLRSIGPALMGGRIADIAVSPTDRCTWYVAVGSGGLWKTTNCGTTWQPIFDDQPSYSIGTVSIDPQQTNVIWVGTGENVSGRHVGWGDGIYRSLDGGATWQKMGLEQSEHIGKILIDPRDSKVVYVAAEGPLWNSGGDRGLYKSEDGGATWRLVLEIDENTGVTDIEFHPENPDVLYAAAYQRRRHIWSLLGGGPQSGIYLSQDGGETWQRAMTGLPKGDMGKIGLAVTPAAPNLVYATIEANEEEKGFYRSLDRGHSWEQRNSYISNGTGPHYYQEIEASPTNPDLIYQMDVFLHVSRDGGNTFDYLGTGREKHSDNHALWIDPDNGQHLIAGTDAGLYESFDEGTSWRHFPNLPISQFYKLALDNSEPFYNILGGAQDLGTLIGPSRTMNIEGVRNQDWYVPLGADGYDCAFDPVDPQISYMEIQQGLLYRHDRRSEEVLNIQPQPAPNEPPERWNWDSPLLISPHNRMRLYFGSQRLWRSEDQGNSWTAISGDLTTNTNRYELELMDRVWSVDALYDNGAMSKYATLTSIAESPQAEGLLYTGSDDGLMHVSENGGDDWRLCSAFPDIPVRSFINDIEASQHDPNTVFAVVDVHKFGDFNPYIFMSTDRGTSWQSIAGDLPEGTIVWVLKQDYVDENLLFIGTEYGIYFSANKGNNWIKLKGGVPTISFRDLELHARDHDLVGATFGRGFYVLDDYAPLRQLSKAITEKSNSIFPVRDAWWYVPNAPMQAKGMPTLGSTSYVADNPPFGALFTYYLADIPKSSKKDRKETEESLRETKSSIPFPGWDYLLEESISEDPRILLLVRDGEGDAVRWLEGGAEAGLQRANWDLKYPAPDPINLRKPSFTPPWVSTAEGPWAAPGEYSVELFVLQDGTLLSQGARQTFEVKAVPTLATKTDVVAVAAFQQKTSDLWRNIAAANKQMGEVSEKIRHIKAALLKTSKVTTDHFAPLNALVEKMSQLRVRLNGHPIQQRMSESTKPSIMSRVGYVKSGHWETRQTPTETQKNSLEIAEKDFAQFKTELAIFLKEVMQYEEALEAAGAPWTPGRKSE